MDAMERVERLAASAQREICPGIDVSERVLRSLRARQSEQAAPHFGTLARFSAVSFVAAFVLGAWAVHAWLAMHDPMVRLFDTVAMVMR